MILISHFVLQTDAGLGCAAEALSSPPPLPPASVTGMYVYFVLQTDAGLGCAAEALSSPPPLPPASVTGMYVYTAEKLLTW